MADVLGREKTAVVQCLTLETPLWRAALVEEKERDSKEAWQKAYCGLGKQGAVLLTCSGWNPSFTKPVRLKRTFTREKILKARKYENWRREREDHPKRSTVKPIFKCAWDYFENGKNSPRSPHVNFSNGQQIIT